MKGKLAGRVAIVTGAGRGIGRAVAQTFATEGAAVVAGARSSSDLEALVEEITGRGARAIAVAGDIGDPATSERLVRAAVETFGGCDVLANLAAIGGPVGNVEELDPDDWNQTFRINVTGTFLACRAVLPEMKRRGGGRIVNVASGLAERVQPGQSAYSATKAAVVQFSRVLAEEARDAGINVNAVHPGIVRTKMVADLLSLPPEGVNESMVKRLRALDADGLIIETETSASFFVWLVSECTDTGKFLKIDEFLR
ncbi:SDR family NAD(P)-dependent oxidoreductase [Microbaculum marinum]